MSFAMLFFVIRLGHIQNGEMLRAKAQGKPKRKRHRKYTNINELFMHTNP